MEWLLFTSHLPVSPSSLRVMVWRRMKSIGAIGLQNGVWILPRNKEHEHFIQELLTYVHEQGGTGQSFIASPMNPAIEEDLLHLLQDQRGEEYAELGERCQDMLKELQRESRKKKFTFAELEENEEEFKKLELWLAKIQGRDPVGGNQAEDAIQQIRTCKAALQEFANQVYARDGLTADENPELSGEK